MGLWRRYRGEGGQSIGLAHHHPSQEVIQAGLPALAALPESGNQISVELDTDGGFQGSFLFTACSGLARFLLREIEKARKNEDEKGKGGRSAAA